MRHCLLISLFVLIAQASWAFVVSDTLIIDGEVIYLEEKQTPITDSLNQARRNDFKERRKPIIWGMDASWGVQRSDFSVSHSSNPMLMEVNEFLSISNNTFYHASPTVGAFFRAHNNIEIGTSINRLWGDLSLLTADVNAGNSLSFYASDSQIYHVFETEVQPSVFELDTAAIPIKSLDIGMRAIQIPLKFRFYVNSFTMKSRWRAFGEISPVYQTLKFNPKSEGIASLLFLNENGEFNFLAIEKESFHSFGVMVGAGAEFKFAKRMNAFAQVNWNFPPLNYPSNAGLNYNLQASNFQLGIRLLLKEDR